MSVHRTNQTHGPTWWTDHRAALDAEWDAREQEPCLDRHAKTRLRVQREAMFAARWRLWRRVTGPQPVHAPVAVSPDDARAREDDRFIADLDRIFGPVVDLQTDGLPALPGNPTKDCRH